MYITNYLDFLVLLRVGAFSLRFGREGWAGVELVAARVWGL